MRSVKISLPNNFKVNIAPQQNLKIEYPSTKNYKVGISTIY